MIPANHNTIASESSNKALEQRIVALVTKYAQPERIYLFGSRARGDAEKRADYDIAIEDQQLSRATLARIRADIDTLPTLLKVDIMWMNKLAENFKQRILDEGIILYEQKSKN